MYAHVCFPSQKVCFCWKPIIPRACWCLESSHPQGKTRDDDANCNIPAGLSGYVNHWLDISGRGGVCERARYIEMSCVMFQNSLFRRWTVSCDVLLTLDIWPSFRCSCLMIANKLHLFSFFTRDTFGIHHDINYALHDMYWQSAQQDVWVQHEFHHCVFQTDVTWALYFKFQRNTLSATFFLPFYPTSQMKGNDYR